MEMTLEVVSFQKSLMGDARTHVFDESGGSIGRGRDNSWVLPDPNRYVSSRHAEIACVDGRFRIVDTSTNGVFVNDDAAALGRDGHAELSDGDRLMIGDYEIAVRIRERAPVPALEPRESLAAFGQQPPADILDVVGRRRAEPRLASLAFTDEPPRREQKTPAAPPPPSSRKPPETAAPLPPVSRAAASESAVPPAGSAMIPDDADFGSAHPPKPAPAAAPPPLVPPPRTPPRTPPLLPDDLDDLLPDAPEPAPATSQPAPAPRSADVLPPGVPLLDPVPGTGNRQEPLSPSRAAPAPPPGVREPVDAIPSPAVPGPEPAAEPARATVMPGPDALSAPLAEGLGLDRAALDDLDPAAAAALVARTARAAALGISGAFDARNALARAAGVELPERDEDERNPFLTFRSGEAALKQSLRSGGPDMLAMDTATKASVEALTASSLAAAAAIDALFDSLAASDAPPSTEELREIFGSAFLNAYHRESRRSS